MRRNRFKANITIKTRVKNNQLTLNKNLFRNKMFNNIIEIKNLLKNLDIFNNKYL